MSQTTPNTAAAITITLAVTIVIAVTDSSGISIPTVYFAEPPLAGTRTDS